MGLTGLSGLSGLSGATSGDYPVMMRFTTATNGAFSFTVKTDAARTLYVLWGDGSALEAFACTTSDTVISHNYASGATKAVEVRGTPAWLTKLDLGTRVVFGLNVSGLTGLTFLVATGAGNTLTGSVTGLTRLTFVSVTGANTLSGSIAACTGLTQLFVGGSNTLTGSVAALTALNYLNVTGSNTLSGSVAGLILLTLISVTGFNSLTGSTAGLTKLTYLVVTGYNSLTWAVGTLTKLVTLTCANNALSQAVVDAILLALYTNRASYTAATMTVTMGGTNSDPSGVYQDTTPPVTGLEMAYKLVVDPQADHTTEFVINY